MLFEEEKKLKKGSSSICYMYPFRGLIQLNKLIFILWWMSLPFLVQRDIEIKGVFHTHALRDLHLFYNRATNLKVCLLTDDTIVFS